MFVKATNQYAKIGFKSQKTAKESCNFLGVVLTLLFDSEQTFRYRDYYIYLPSVLILQRRHRRKVATVHSWPWEMNILRTLYNSNT